MQPANALAAPTSAENFLELGGQNGARKDNFGWLQPSSENSRDLTVCYAAAKTAGGKSPAILGGIGKNPLEAWNATPYDGKLQILVAILLAEFHSEFGTYKKHYTKGGPLPGNQIERTDNGWRDVWGGKVLNIPFGPDDTEEMFRRRQNAELNNGRLAMIGIMGFSAAALVPGSVPALDGLDGVVAQGWTISA